MVEGLYSTEGPASAKDGEYGGRGSVGESGEPAVESRAWIEHSVALEFLGEKRID